MTRSSVTHTRPLFVVNIGADTFVDVPIFGFVKDITQSSARRGLVHCVVDWGLVHCVVDWGLVHCVVDWAQSTN